MKTQNNPKGTRPIDGATVEVGSAESDATDKTVVDDPKKAFFSAKNVSLLALVFQQVALVLMIRHSRTRKNGEGESVRPYLASRAVVTAECLKLALNLCLELIIVKPDKLSDLVTGLASPEALKLGPPAFLSVIQNNLLFLALGNLTVPAYQVTNQGKLLTTLAFSRLLLNKSIILFVARLGARSDDRATVFN